MEPAPATRRTSGMRLLLALCATALVAAPPADAKFRMRLELSTAQPRAGAAVHVRLRTDADLDATALMRVVAVAPGAALMDVVARATGGSVSGRPRIYESFALRLTQTGPRLFEGELTFARPGRWRLVVPNWGAPGYAMPPPLVR